ncbi:glutathione S-transferase [Ahrensia sp. R2A130]|nr:glutathione S-transferase [Ahrensia sp. R2A130]
MYRCRKKVVTMLTLYSMPSSGNSYKVRLTLAHLAIPFEHVTTEWDEGRELTKQADFLKLNPAGKVPLLRLEDGRTLSESNAIVLYLAEGSELVPHNSFNRAKMFEWMFFEQYSHEPAVAVRTGIVHTYKSRNPNPDAALLADLLTRGDKALDVMEARLSQSPWLAGDQFSAADIVLYGYTHKASLGGFDLSKRPAISKWLDRFAALDGHVDMGWPENAPI